ncbi:MAG: GNAT family N-acetyltransferase [Cyanobacteria bacterium P01_G01_bin.67]
MNPQASTIIKLATSVTEIEQCFPVMSQLRLDLNREQFVQQVQAQMTGGYQLAYIKDFEVLGVAGFRIDTSLSWGKYLYVADLVVEQNKRSQGYGEALFTWLIAFAKQHHCQQLHLDSGVQRFAAHRFYLQQKMHISSHHFTLKL